MTKKKKQTLYDRVSKLSEAKKLFLFLMIFAVVGGSWMAYQSFAFDPSDCIAKGEHKVTLLWYEKGEIKSRDTAKRKYYNQIKKGDKGPCVALMEKILKNRSTISGAPGGIESNGKFEDKEEKRVRYWQMRYSNEDAYDIKDMVRDGIVGPDTWVAIQLY